MLLECSGDILRLCTAQLLDLFAPQPAAALCCTCKRLHYALQGQLEFVRQLRAGAIKLACDAAGLKAVLVRFEALRSADTLSKSDGFGGYSYTSRDCELVARLVRAGAFAAPRGVLLNMSLSCIGPTGAAALADAIAAGMVVRRLCLDDANVTDEGSMALALALGGSHLERLEALSLRRNRIGDAGATALASALSSIDGGLPSLCELNLGRNPIGFEGTEALRKAADGGAMPNVALEVDPPIVEVVRARLGAAPGSTKHASGRGAGVRRGGGSVARPSPPSPPSPPDLIHRILKVVVRQDGNMSDEEAAAILRVTDRKPKWLLAQVHPDKHPAHRHEHAAAAATRVNQAIDVRKKKPRV